MPNLGRKIRYSSTVTMRAFVAIILLAVVLFGMFLTHNTDWSVFDFIILGLLVVGALNIYKCGVTKLNGSKQRLATVVLLLIIFVLIWGELAVGLFGTPFAGS